MLTALDVFLVGDSGSELVKTVLDLDGVAVNVTGAGAIALKGWGDNQKPFDLVGSIKVANPGAFSFGAPGAASGAAALVGTERGALVTVTAFMEYTLAGKVYKERTATRYGIKRWS